MWVCGWWCALRFPRARDDDRCWLLVVWSGASCEASWKVDVLRVVVVVMLAVVGGCWCMDGSADGDSRIKNKGDEEKACSEFWSSCLSMLQSRGPRSCP